MMNEQDVIKAIPKGKKYDLEAMGTVTMTENVFIRIIASLKCESCNLKFEINCKGMHEGDEIFEEYVEGDKTLDDCLNDWLRCIEQDNLRSVLIKQNPTVTITAGTLDKNGNVTVNPNISETVTGKEGTLRYNSS